MLKMGSVSELIAAAKRVKGLFCLVQEGESERLKVCFQEQH